MTNKKSKVSNVPNLRFPGFDGEWEIKKLGEVMDFKITNSFSRENLNYELGTVKNIHYGDIHTKFKTLFNIKKEIVPFINEEMNLRRISDENYCREGDIIFADASEDLNDVGKSIEIINVNGEKLLSGLHTLLARPKANIFHLGFNGYLFKSNQVRTQIQKESQGSKVLSINVGRISKIDLSFPAVVEQEKISTLFSLLDKRIHTQNKIIEELKLLKNTLSKKIFSCELNFNDQEGNRYPEWHSIALGNIGEIITGKTPSTNDLNLWNGDIQFVTPTDITESKYQYSTERTIKRTNKLRILPPKSIMYTCIASIGKMSLSMKSCVTNQQINSIIPKPEFNNEFVFYALSNISEFIKSTQSSSTMPIINKTEFSKFKISTPSLQEQTKISHFLSSIDIKIDIENNFLNKLEKQKQYLLVNLFI